MKVDDHPLISNLTSPSGEKEAFGSLYRKYSGKCRGFIFSLTKDKEVAEDLTHDIFVKIWQKREIVSHVDSFSSYLFKMAKNSVMDYFESNAINRKFISRQMLCAEDFREYVEEKINMEDLQLLIFKIVSDMPEQRRKIFTMSRYNGLSNKEIAEKSNISVRTVENHITTALAQIREALALI